jgi:hypothetical protein
MIPFLAPRIVFARFSAISQECPGAHVRNVSSRATGDAVAEATYLFASPPLSVRILFAARARNAREVAAIGSKASSLAGLIANRRRDLEGVIPNGAVLQAE